MRKKQVCRVHGGKGGRRPSHGLFAFDMSRLGEEIQEKVERHLANPDPTNLRPQIALCRAYLEIFLEASTPASSYDPPPLDSAFYKILFGFVSKLSRLAKSQAEIEWAPQHLITASQFMMGFNAVLDGVRMHVSSPEEVMKVYEYVESTLGLAGLEERKVHALPAPRDQQ